MMLQVLLILTVYSQIYHPPKVEVGNIQGQWIENNAQDTICFKNKSGQLEFHFQEFTYQSTIHSDSCSLRFVHIAWPPSYAHLSLMGNDSLIMIRSSHPDPVYKGLDTLYYSKMK